MCEPRIPNMRGIRTARTKPLKVVAPVGEPARTQVAEFRPAAQEAGGEAQSTRLMPLN